MYADQNQGNHPNLQTNRKRKRYSHEVGYFPTNCLPLVEAWKKTLQSGIYMAGNPSSLNQAKTDTAQGNQGSGESDPGVKNNISLGSQKAKTQFTTTTFITNNSSSTQGSWQGKIQITLPKTVVSELSLYATS